MITKELWEINRPKTNPFLKFEFMNALLSSASIGPDAGWTPAMIEGDGIILNFIKTHSYGEYIFDWSWAEAYERHGIPYYPKLTSMLPFTPVTTAHFLLPEFDKVKAKKLLTQYDEFYHSQNFSSGHFLFLTPQEREIFEEGGFIIRESMQYHFFNEGYEDFDDFLLHLKTKKAKNIKSERSFAEVKIKRYTGADLTLEHAKRMYQFYISTIVNKNSFDYLNERFFHHLFENLKENILYVEASLDGIPLAGSLFFYDQEKLYGRYWGSNEYVPNLHFELCYYQGIEFCIERNLRVFEAGAQGEHKIARGFRPVRTYSAHKFKHPGFAEAIKNFIEAEKLRIEELIAELSLQLPFKMTN
jgi:predicted N-acyltransferase